MTGEGRRESAGAELDLADEELRAAEALLADGIPRIAVGRMYLAVFHARLQKFREEADYAPAFVVDDDGAREDLEAARAFVAGFVPSCPLRADATEGWHRLVGSIWWRCGLVELASQYGPPGARRRSVHRPR